MVWNLNVLLHVGMYNLDCLHELRFHSRVGNGMVISGYMNVSYFQLRSVLVKEWKSGGSTVLMCIIFFDSKP